MFGMEQWPAKFMEMAEAWERLQAAVSLRCDPPVDDAAVAQLEWDLGYGLPQSVKRFLASVSGGIVLDVVSPCCRTDISPDSIRPELEALPAFFSLDISLEGIRDGEKQRLGWIKAIYHDLENEYDRAWHNKLGFINAREGGLEDGDVVAFDLADTSAEPRVVVLSHDGFTRQNGAVIADNFCDLVERIIGVGGCGLLVSDILEFMSGDDKHIRPDSPAAVRNRRLLGLSW